MKQICRPHTIRHGTVRCISVLSMTFWNQSSLVCKQVPESHWESSKGFAQFRLKHCCKRFQHLLCSNAFVAPCEASITALTWPVLGLCHRPECSSEVFVLPVHLPVSRVTPVSPSGFTCCFSCFSRSPAAKSSQRLWSTQRKKYQTQQLASIFGTGGGELHHSFSSAPRNR